MQKQINYSNIENLVLWARSLYLEEPSEMKIEAIAIIGTGVIGSSWAAFYAAKGYPVKMYDVDAQTCRQGHQQALDIIEQLRELAILAPEMVAGSKSRIVAADGLAQAVADVQLVQECVAENYEVKQQVFRELDAETKPDVILASSSSGLLMTEIQKVTRHPGRCLVAHPFNPPHLIPLVELVPGEATDDDRISEMKRFYEALGKVPVVLKKAVPGHIANRLAQALWREAVDLVVQGIASVEDVDKAIYAGPGLRWAIMGPHLIYHLGGGRGGMDHFIDHFGPAVKTVFESLASWTTLPPDTKAVLTEGLKQEIGDRSPEELSRWRDEKLSGLLKLIYDS
jgi:carnitine 3-dehydrogenase